MEKNKYLTFFHRHLSKFLLGIAVLGVAGFLIEKRAHAHKIRSKQDYLVLRQIDERFRQGEPLSIESLDLTEKILSRHPELHAKYDFLMTYSLLQQEKISQALPYATAILQRVDDSPYHDYAQTSLLIAQENYPEAYAQAELLESSLVESDSHPTLRALNMLRLVFLANQLKHQELKQEYWTILQNLPSFSKIEPLFQTGKLNLRDFIENLT